MLIMLAMSISIVIVALIGARLIWGAVKDSNEAWWFRLIEMVFGLIVIAFALSLPIFAFLLIH